MKMFHYLFFSILFLTFYQTNAFDVNRGAAISLSIVDEIVNNLTSVTQESYVNSLSKKIKFKRLDVIFENSEYYLPVLNYSKYDFHVFAMYTSFRFAYYDSMLYSFKIFRNKLYSEELESYEDNLKTLFNPKLQSEEEIYPDWQIFNRRYESLCSGDYLDSEITYSLYEIIHDFYNNIIIPTEMRRLIMKNYNFNMYMWNLNNRVFTGETPAIKKTKANFSAKITESEIGFIDRITEASKTIKKIFKQDSLSIRLFNQCQRFNTVNFFATMPVFQSYVLGTETEPLNNHSIYRDDNQESEYCTKFQSERRCTGNITGCHPIEYYHMYICPAGRDEKEDKLTNTTSRYTDATFRYVDKDYYYQLFDYYSPHRQCPRTLFELNKKLSKPTGCDYYMCQCENPEENIDRYFDLREVIADVEDNKVVTGLRFVRKNHVFHIQIQQGQIMKTGAINLTTVEWKPVEFLNPLTDFWIDHDHDYFKVTSQSNKIIVDIIPDEKIFTDNVVTGLQFITDKEKRTLILSFLLTAVDFQTGQLDIEDSEWVNIDDTDKAITIQAYFETHLGRMSMPFISLKESEPHIPMPLSGAGMMLKSFEFEKNPEDAKLPLKKYQILSPVGVSYNFLKL